MGLYTTILFIFQAAISRLFKNIAAKHSVMYFKIITGNNRIKSYHKKRKIT
ncbi:hypothetical protein ALIPUT_00221 [Alistipes putredinis DSM 17216]|uniref:Uncharacterized protein n=1 Tax=Alistipes putredinis DSM 17216 TaxID=445970 RepID=B0MU99_9BACT|nr:hypothetical protein ALIPUT_00221 [Alistipes putredinis DSM 17216]